MALKDIVNINITRQTTGVSVAAFNVPLILSAFAADKTTTPFARARSYGDLQALSDDGWKSDNAVYKMANAIFAQNPSVSRVVVGRMETGEDVADAFAAIANEDSTWYGVIVDHALFENAEDIAAWVEANKRFAIIWSAEETAYDATSEADLASKLKAKAYDRTAVIYHAMQQKEEEMVDDPDYPDAAWMGESFPYDPGSSTWAYKTLKGIAADNINASKEVPLQSKNCNYYSEVGGVNITQEGKVASGEWIDIIIGTDWIEARLREAVFSALVNNRKIPGGDDGITLIEGLVKGVLNDAVSAGILLADSVVVTVPRWKDVSTADKIARKLTGIKFTANYQGAIHRVKIDGTISV